MRDSIKHMFICDFCRQICDGDCFEKLMAIKNKEVEPGDKDHETNKDLIGRKQIIHYLGKYCDSPCDLQREDYTQYDEKDGLKPLVDAVKYLTARCNKLLLERFNGKGD